MHRIESDAGMSAETLLHKNVKEIVVMEYKVDKLLKKFQNNELIYGTHTFLGGAVTTEMYGKVGFDVVWIDGEHGYLDNKDVLNSLIGADTSDLVCFYRVPWNDPVLAKPILDMGAHGIIFPMVNTKEEAEKAVAACRYPPVGNRGWAPRRPTNWGQISGQEYADVISKKVWCLTQCESITAVENLDEILTVEGLDGIIVGPCDLSASMGLLPNTGHPEVKKVLDKIAAKCKAAGKLFCVSMGGASQETLDEWAQRGVSIIFLNDESNYIMDGATAALNSLKKAAEKKI